MHRTTGRNRPRDSAQHGFTMIELLITLSLTVFGLIGLLALHKALAVATTNVTETTEGLGMAQKLLEELRSRERTAMYALLDAPPINVPTCAAHTGLERDCTYVPLDGPRGTRSYRRRVIVTPLSAVSDSLVRVRVEVGWSDGGFSEGEANGFHDHLIAIELIKTLEEVL